MIDQLFTSYGGWDDVETLSIIEYDCVLAVPIGPHPAGKEFKAISVDLEKGTLTLDDVNEVYKLNLVVGERIDSAS